MFQMQLTHSGCMQFVNPNRPNEATGIFIPRIFSSSDIYGNSLLAPIFIVVYMCAFSCAICWKDYDTFRVISALALHARIRGYLVPRFVRCCGRLTLLDDESFYCFTCNNKMKRGLMPFHKFMSTEKL